jgi:hypothetical protein
MSYFTESKAWRKEEEEVRAFRALATHSLTDNSVTHTLTHTLTPHTHTRARTHTHTLTHTHTHTHAHARTRTHARTHAHARTQSIDMKIMRMALIASCMQLQLLQLCCRSVAALLALQLHTSAMS